VNLISTRHKSPGDFFVVKFFNFLKSIFGIYIMSQIHCFFGGKIVNSFLIQKIATIA